MAYGIVQVYHSLASSPGLQLCGGKAWYRLHAHSAKSAESEYVRILWACTFTDNFTEKYTEI